MFLRSPSSLVASAEAAEFSENFTMCLCAAFSQCARQFQPQLCGVLSQRSVVGLNDLSPHGWSWHVAGHLAPDISWHVNGQLAPDLSWQVVGDLNRFSCRLVAGQPVPTRRGMSLNILGRVFSKFCPHHSHRTLHNVVQHRASRVLRMTRGLGQPRRP